MKMAALGGFTGFNFGAKPAATTSSSVGGFSFGGASTTATGASSGFSFGTSTATSGGQGGFNFGTTPSTGTGITLGLSTATTKPSLGFGLGSSVTQPSTSLFGTTNTASTTAGNFVLVNTSLSTGTTSASSTGTTLGGLGTSTTSNTLQPGFGIGIGTKPFGLAGTTTLGSGLGTGLLGTTGTGSIFGATVAKTTAPGLGGIDPTSTTTAGYSSSGTKLVNGKALKETNVSQELIVDVDNFQKFVKEEKIEMENIKRMTATPMHKVQEDTVSLRQLLSVVSNSVQRNALAVEKLKKKMTQELKSAEMAQRTKDIPASLQYENTAPTEYFQNLVADFESQMLNYRHQIEVMESHLASLNQPSKFTPEEMITLLKKLSETFVALAAQLHQIHDAVKTQKEHFLNYRKIFHGDTKNIFEKQKRTTVKVSQHHKTDTLGPNPFPGVNNAVAVAMATAMNRTQQHQGGRPPVTGFAGGSGTGGGLLSTVPITSSGLTGFGTVSTQSSGFKGFGTGTYGLFGSNNNSTGGSVFGPKVSQPSSVGFNFSTPASATGVALPQQNLSASTEQPFQLNKPPLGTKRGKR